MDIYVSWTKGIADDLHALEFVRNSTIIAGIELCNLDNDVEKIRAEGVRISIHTPGIEKTANFCRDDFDEMIEGQIGQRMVEVCQMADAPVIGFHLGYSASAMIKMASFPNQAVPGTEIHDREVLKELLVKNIVKCENAINSNVELDQHKTLILETMDYSRSTDIPWEHQRVEVCQLKSELEAYVAKEGTNGALKWVTEPQFVGEVLQCVNQKSRHSIGFLFDVAHNFISWDGKKHFGETSLEWIDYVSEMIEAIQGTVHQIHLNLPGGDKAKGYIDSHGCFDPDDSLSALILETANRILKESVGVELITLEMRTGNTPLEHVRMLERQADFALRWFGF